MGAVTSTFLGDVLLVYIDMGPSRFHVDDEVVFIISVPLWFVGDAGQNYTRCCGNPNTEAQSNEES
jgi:hypothetical protein